MLRPDRIPPGNFFGLLLPHSGYLIPLFQGQPENKNDQSARNDKRKELQITADVFQLTPPQKS
jgi:hypothetical protein